jgi:hypothetical protein
MERRESGWFAQRACPIDPGALPLSSHCWLSAPRRRPPPRGSRCPFLFPHVAAPMVENPRSYVIKCPWLVLGATRLTQNLRFPQLVH